jgi:hypothetical protein
VTNIIKKKKLLCQQGDTTCTQEIHSTFLMEVDLKGQMQANQLKGHCILVLKTVIGFFLVWT